MEEYICSSVVAPVAAIWAESTAIMLEPTGAAPLMLVPVTTTVSRPLPCAKAGVRAAPSEIVAAPQRKADRKAERLRRDDVFFIDLPSLILFSEFFPVHFRIGIRTIAI